MFCDIGVLMDIIDGRVRGIEYRIGVAISIGVSGSANTCCASSASARRISLAWQVGKMSDKGRGMTSSGIYDLGVGSNGGGNEDAEISPEGGLEMVVEVCSLTIESLGVGRGRSV